MAIYQIEFQIREDPWGMLGKNSTIGQLLLSKTDPRLEKKIGEAWAGAHSQRPAQIKGSKKNLLEIIKDDPVATLGHAVLTKFGANLPFLLKILTIASPLSIQVHPNLLKSEALSVSQPEKYRDQTHKPEIGVAITETKLLLGFRPFSEMLGFIKSYPPAERFFQGALLTLAGSSKLDEEAKIKILYTRLLSAEEHEIRVLNFEISAIFEEKNNLTAEEKIFVKINHSFPVDCGVFQVFILNLVMLNSNEGIFIPPDVPHAYLSGEIVECMATSDFVIRAGLTIKEKDIQSLLSVVDYKPFLVEKIIPLGAVRSAATDNSSDFVVYQTPTTEFKLECFSGATNREFEIKESPVIYFCLKGQAEISDMLPSADNKTVKLKSGDVLYLSPESSKRHHAILKGHFYRISINLDS